MQPKAVMRPVCLVVGAGDFTGGAIAKRFAREGLVACVVRRHADRLAPLVEEIEGEGGRAIGYGVDARQESEVVELVDRVEREVGPIEVAIFNIGANVRFSILETTARVYRKVWEMAALAGFLTGRECAKRMVERGRGTILFTGATHYVVTRARAELANNTGSLGLISGGGGNRTAGSSPDSDDSRTVSRTGIDENTSKEHEQNALPDILMTMSQIPDVHRELAAVGAMFAVFRALKGGRLGS